MKLDGRLASLQTLLHPLNAIHHSISIDRLEFHYSVHPFFPLDDGEGFRKSFWAARNIVSCRERNNNKSDRPPPPSSSLFSCQTEKGKRIKLSRRSFFFLANIQGHGTGLYKDAEDRFDTAWHSELVDYLPAKSSLFLRKLLVVILAVHYFANG